MSTDLPGVDISIRNGGVGLVSSGSGLPLVIGYAKGGTANKLYQFMSSSACVDTLIGGPAVEQGAPIAGRGGVLVLCTAASTAGSSGSVEVARIGSSTGTITLAGTPWNAWKLRVAVTGSGGLGVGKFKYALDGYSTTAAYTWSEEYLIPAGGTFAFPGTTLVATFVPGAGPAIFDVGDMHRADCVAPHYTTTDLTAAVSYLISAAAKAVLGSQKIRKVIFAGHAPTASAQVVLIAAASGHLDTLALQKHFAGATISGGADTTANFKTAIAAYAGDRIAVSHGLASITSESGIPGCGVLEVPLSHAVGERLAGLDLSENMGRFLSGTLRGVMRISHDERFENAFTAADRIITARSYDNEGGFFITNGYIRSSGSSDFKYVDWRLLTDEACDTAVSALQKFTLENLDAKTDGTGQLSDADAGVVETAVQLALNARIMQPKNKSGRKGHATACRFTVDRTNDFYGTGKVQGFIAIQARRPAEKFDIQVGLVRQMPE